MDKQGRTYFKGADGKDYWLKNSKALKVVKNYFGSVKKISEYAYYGYPSIYKVIYGEKGDPREILYSAIDKFIDDLIKNNKIDEMDKNGKKKYPVNKENVENFKKEYDELIHERKRNKNRVNGFIALDFLRIYPIVFGTFSSLIVKMKNMHEIIRNKLYAFNSIISRRIETVFTAIKTQATNLVPAILLLVYLSGVTFELLCNIYLIIITLQACVDTSQAFLVRYTNWNGTLVNAVSCLNAVFTTLYISLIIYFVVSNRMFCYAVLACPLFIVLIIMLTKIHYIEKKKCFLR